MSFMPIFIFLSIPLAQAQAAPASGASQYANLIPFLLVFVIFYFLLIRPQQKQQKLRKQMIADVKKGDNIITTGGLHGKVVGTADRILTVEFSENVKIKMDRDGVLSVNSNNIEPKENK